MKQDDSRPAPAKPYATTDGPALLEAINLTFRTIEKRTRWYRNLVIAVSLTTVASVIVAGFLHQWLALVGLLTLPLYVRGFVFFDNQIVSAWRRDLLQLRDEKGLSIAQLEKALSGYRHLPQATLRSMLAVLTSEMPKA